MVIILPNSDCGYLHPNLCVAGVSMPRESKTGAHLPNERRLSLDLFRSPSEPHSVVNQITSYWLYMIASDMSGASPNQLIVNGKLPYTPYSNVSTIKASRMLFPAVRQTLSMSTVIPYTFLCLTLFTMLPESRVFPTRELFLLNQYNADWDKENKQTMSALS